MIRTNRAEELEKSSYILCPFCAHIVFCHSLRCLNSVMYSITRSSPAVDLRFAAKTRLCIVIFGPLAVEHAAFLQYLMVHSSRVTSSKYLFNSFK